MGAPAGLAVVLSSCSKEVQRETPGVEPSTMLNMAGAEARSAHESPRRFSLRTWAPATRDVATSKAGVGMAMVMPFQV